MAARPSTVNNQEVTDSDFRGCCASRPTSSHPARKDHGRKRRPRRNQPKQPKLSVRTTLVLLLALYAALAAAALLYAAHQVIPLIVMGSVGVFTTAYDFLNGKKGHRSVQRRRWLVTRVRPSACLEKRAADHDWRFPGSFGCLPRYRAGPDGRTRALVAAARVRPPRRPVTD